METEPSSSQRDTLTLQVNEKPDDHVEMIPRASLVSREEEHLIVCTKSHLISVTNLLKYVTLEHKTSLK